ncbi:hypothetical protein E2C01_032091 [Portunus trituberculatus]|uniref:Uncharacterized protein n=1 Tax=Portunus trituberculatus TaxID=210409 RepID=A0A5B7F0F5_PORTR|nr:hypothetical protein [Portunus trituberculatus]
MKRCLQGLTQNPNESLHSRIWMHCPKHISAVKRKLDFVTVVATMEYNNGYVASNLHVSLGLPYSSILAKALREKDKMMNRPLAKKMRNKWLQRELFYT